MKSFGRVLLLTTLLVPVCAMAQPQMAEDAPAKPAKSAQDCADELLRSKEAIESSGESPQEFFHRCWWDSVPGRPTPIKTPRATWDPGHSRITKKNAVKPHQIEAQQTKEGKPAVVSKPVPGKEKSAERIQTAKPTSDASAPTPPAKPGSVVENQPTNEHKPSTIKPTPSRDGASKGAASKDSAKDNALTRSGGRTAPNVPKQTEASKPSPSRETEKAKTTASEPGAASTAPKAGTVVTAPNAAPASLKPVAPGAVVVKSTSKKAKRLAARRSRVGERTAESRMARLAAPQRSVPAWHPHHDTDAGPVFAARPVHHARHGSRYPRLAATGAPLGRGWGAGSPVVCLYASPDHYGRSRCVPLP